MKSELLEIPGLTEKQVELFEAVGVVRKSELREFDLEKLHNELTDANGFLQICEKTPDLRRLEEWQSLAADPDEEVTLAAAPKETATQPRIKNTEITEKPTEFLRDARQEKSDSLEWSQALPVPVAQMMRSGLAIEEIPAARVIAAPAKEEDIAFAKIDDSTTEAQPVSQIDKSEKTLPANFATRGRGIMTTVRAETNQGRSEHSRSFIRGVLYPRVGDLYAGALSTILIFIFFPFAVISGIMVIFNPNPWLVIAPLGLVISALFYLMFGLKPRCRICGQGVFVSKSCHRHTKAHHIPVIGYILPTALQMLIFRWFRCIYCGTSIRLKE